MPCFFSGTLPALGPSSTSPRPGQPSFQRTRTVQPQLLHWFLLARESPRVPRPPPPPFQSSVLRHLLPSHPSTRRKSQRAQAAALVASFSPGCVGRRARVPTSETPLRHRPLCVGRPRGLEGQAESSRPPGSTQERSAVPSGGGGRKPASVPVSWPRSAPLPALRKRPRFSRRRGQPVSPRRRRRPLATAGPRAGSTDCGGALAQPGWSLGAGGDVVLKALSAQEAARGCGQRSAGGASGPCGRGLR